MGAFGGLLFTNRGRNLQAKAQAGAALKFTRIALGDGALGSGSIADLTALKNEIKSIAVTKLRILEGGKAVIGAILSNQSLNVGFWFRELGLYAQDPDLGEILYCYGNAGAGADYIPAGGGPDIVEKAIDVITIAGNAANISAVIDESLIFATLADIDYLNAKIQDMTATTETTLNTHINDATPHRFTDGGKTYKWGLAVKNGVVNMVYEEMV